MWLVGVLAAGSSQRMIAAPTPSGTTGSADNSRSIAASNLGFRVLRPALRRLRRGRYGSLSAVVILPTRLYLSADILIFRRRAQLLSSSIRPSATRLTERERPLGAARRMGG